MLFGKCADYLNGMKHTGRQNKPEEREGQSMNLYRMQEAEHQRRVNDFLGKYAFFAFDEKQFNEGLAKLGIAPGTEGALVSIPGGGYLLADKGQELKDLLRKNSQERADAIRDTDTGAQFAYDMFRAALNDTEYSYSEDEEDALQRLGYSMQDIESDPILKPAFDKACKDILQKEA